MRMQGIALVISHEMAHQWIGNLVTMVKVSLLINGQTRQSRYAHHLVFRKNAKKKSNAFTLFLYPSRCTFVWMFE